MQDKTLCCKTIWMTACPRILVRREQGVSHRSVTGAVCTNSPCAPACGR